MPKKGSSSKMNFGFYLGIITLIIFIIKIAYFSLKGIKHTTKPKIPSIICLKLILNLNKK